jgi:hypothetical protein
LSTESRLVGGHELGASSRWMSSHFAAWICRRFLVDRSCLFQSNTLAI